jgi:CheY-like chemotaxis protein
MTYFCHGIEVKMGTSQEKMVLIIEKEENSSPDIRDWAFQNPVIPVFVSSAVEALLWLGKGNIPHLILVDADMKAMPGSEFVRTIKSSGFFHDIPLIVFGYPEQHPLMAEMRQAGAADHLFMPLEHEDLEARFAHYFNQELIS